MKILHAPYNIVNIPYSISREFRNMGFECDIMSLDEDPRNFNQSDYIIGHSSNGVFNNKVRLLSFATFAVLKYDLFQFHQRITLLPREYDIPVIKWLKKKYYIYHHGSDVNNNDNYLKHVPHAKGAEAIFISTPDLYDFVPKSAILVPQAISIMSLKKYISQKKKFNNRLKDRTVITHAIYGDEARKHKGSDIIINAIEKLKARGLDIDFRFFIGKEHDFVLNEISKADIHIDQLIYGWYGTISAEAMAIGTPVVCFIRPDLEKFAKNLPIFRAEKTNLAEKLDELIHNLKLKRRLSLAGKEYVHKVHDAPQVSKKILDIYNF